MECKIVRLDDLGRGICYVDGKVTFVPKTVIGDVVELTITKTKKNYNEGKLVKLITPSSKRVTAPCRYFDVCGGCSLQNLSYEDTVEYKITKVKTLFKKNGIEASLNFIKNPSPFNYRNKITLKVIDGVIGYYEEKSHTVIKINKCLIASNAINNVINFLEDLKIKNGEIVIRTNKNEEILLVIKNSDKIEIDWEKLKGKCKLCGVVLNDKTIYGESFLYEIINDLVYRISYDSFFQVNPFVCEKLFEVVAENILDTDKVLDLYCGVGTLSLTAACKASSVVGIEIVPNAVLNAIFNAKINKLSNVNFVLNDATEAVKVIDFDFNKLIVDPPRSGLSKDVIDMIIKQKPEKVIYVSCDIQTFIRDIKLLEDKYEVEKLYAFDMFSYTYHVECLCVLKRR